MIIARITGGLGNQLFQYAMAKRLALHQNTELLLDTTAYQGGIEARPDHLAAFARPLALFRFAVKARAATDEEISQLRDDFYRSTTRDRIVRKIRRIHRSFLWKRSHIIEHQYRFQPEALAYPDNTYLQGFWQSPKYFNDIAPLIREEFTPLDSSIRDAAKEFVNALRRKHGTVVSLHVRRGDMAYAYEVLRNPGIIHSGPVGLGYFHEAMDRFPPDTCFLVFSDSPQDIDWCRKNLQARCLEFSSAESDLWDFSAMQFCDHHIIANSTFSWWAAWLDAKSNARVICPVEWASPGSKVAMDTIDLLPPAWEKIHSRTH
jgi:hypothetical protein